MSARDACTFLSDGSRRYNGDEVLKAGFKKGAILRVGMLNFLTYDECDVFPGPKLNIILGPNGTGKSTITHAICLACGGKPETLGRSPDLKQFVKHDKEGNDAYVEVDLLTNDMSTPPEITCVRRYIHSNKVGRLYMVDFKASKTETVKAIMKSVNIDVDNLCCFMAQDKVGKFTTISAKGIMEQTLQNIISDDGESQNGTGYDEGTSTRTLYDVQQELNNIEESKRAKGAEMRQKEDLLAVCNTRINGLQPEIDAMRQQDENRLLLSKYELHHTVTESGEMKANKVHKQALVDEAEAQLQRAKDSIAPLEVQERDLRYQLEKQVKSQSSSVERLRKADDIAQSNRKKIEATDIQLGVTSEQIANLDTERASKQRHLDSTEREAAKVRNDLDRANHAIKDCEAGIAEIKAKSKQAEQDKEAAEDIIHEKNNVLEELRQEEHQIRKRLSAVRDPRQIYHAELQKNSRMWEDEIKAMEHISSKPETFKKEVIGPIGCFLRCTDKDVAAILNFELRNDINSFIVQTPEDEKTLRNIAPKAKIYTVKSVDIEPFRSVYSPAVLETCKEFGFLGFLRNFIDCHDLVMTWMCKVQRGVLSTLYAKTQDKRNFTDRHANLLCPGGSGPMNFKLVLRAGNPRESGPRSSADFIQYGANFSRYNALQGRTSTAKHLEMYLEKGRAKSQFVTSGDAASEDSGARSELEDSLDRLAHKKADIEKIVKNTQNKVKDIQTAINGFIQKQKTFKEGLRAPQFLEQKLSKLEETIKRVKNELSKDTQDQKKKLVATYHSQIAEILGYAEVIVHRSEDCVKLQADAAAEDEARISMESALEDVRTALHDAREGLTALENRKADAILQRDEVNRALEVATKRLETLAKEYGGSKAFVEFYVKVKAELPEKSLDDIEYRIQQLTHSISQAVENPKALERYEAHLAERVILQEAYARLQAEYGQHEQHVVRRSTAWLNQVGHIVEKLHTKFQQYMSKLQYKGAVDLHKTGTIAEYEMRLSVSYTEGGGLTVLDGARHSGGERAVATIMYLMALQELSRAPFRAVDEINQGMDERNERLVFDQIVQSSTVDTVSARRSHQYFLISPKLLQGLRSMEHPDVTVLMVWNGAGVDKHKWQISDMLADVLRKQKRGLSDTSNSALNGEKRNDQAKMGARIEELSDGEEAEEEEAFVPKRRAVRG